jgi:hypothetical protein
MFTLAVVIFAFAKRDLSIQLNLDDSTLLEKGDLIAKVTLKNHDYRPVAIHPAFTFSIRALTHYERLTTTWDDSSHFKLALGPAQKALSAEKLVLMPFQKVVLKVNLNDALWHTSRDEFRSDWTGTHKKLGDVMPRGKYSVTCAAAFPGSKHKPTVCDIQSNAVDLSVPPDSGGRIESLRKTLADPKSTRESLWEALQQASIWRATEVVEQISERLLHDEDEQTRRQCARVLRRIADDTVVPQLIEALRDDSYHVRTECHHALLAMTPLECPDEYSYWREWWMRNGKSQRQIPWGRPEGNLQMRITTSRTVYVQGEDVNLSIMFRTVSNLPLLLPRIESESPEANADTAFFTLEATDENGRQINLAKAEPRLDMCRITHYNAALSGARNRRLPLNRWKIRTDAGEHNFCDVPGVYTLRLTFSPIHSDERLWKGTIQSNPLTISILAK